MSVPSDQSGLGLIQFRLRDGDATSLPHLEWIRPRIHQLIEHFSTQSEQSPPPGMNPNTRHSCLNSILRLSVTRPLLCSRLPDHNHTWFWSQILIIFLTDSVHCTNSLSIVVLTSKQSLGVWTHTLVRTLDSQCWPVYLNSRSVNSPS